MQSRYSFVQTSYLSGTVSLSEFKRHAKNYAGLAKIFLELLEEDEWSKDLFVHIDYSGGPGKERLVITGDRIKEGRIILSSNDAETVEKVKEAITPHLSSRISEF